MNGGKLDVSLLILRLAGLFLGLNHGLGKVIALATGDRGFAGALTTMGFPLPHAFAWAAALSELAGILVALGLLSRTAAGFAAVTMAVAAFGRHKAHLHLLATLWLWRATPDQVGKWGNPELALLYLACLLPVLLLGPGRYSIDARQRRR